MRVINQKARFNYDIAERVEAGIVLTGPEVKSAKAGGVDLGNAYAKIRTSKFGAMEVFSINIHIYPYKHADNTNYDPGHERKLLLHQKEIVQLASKMKQSRLLLVPTAMYTKDGKVKLELGLARGKKKYEKRESIKQADVERDMEREMK